MSSPNPPNGGAEAPHQVYDRQLRLWGVEGQQALSGAHIVALGATATVCEALKTVILTGVRAVTIVDDSLVTPDRLAENFFLSHEQRKEGVKNFVAENAARNLSMLNQDCLCLYSTLSPRVWADTFVQKVAQSQQSDFTALNEFFSGSSTTVSSKAPHTLKELCNPTRPFCQSLLVSSQYSDFSFVSPLCRELKRLMVRHSLPMFLLHTNGLMGYLEPLHSNGVVVEASVTPTEDLRVFNPFPSLQAWFEANDPDGVVQDPQYQHCTEEERLSVHSHIPYICLLYHANRKVEPSLAGGNSAQHRTALVRQLDAMMKRKEPPEENFLEAKNVNALIRIQFVATKSKQLYEVGYLNHMKVKNPSLGAFGALLRLSGKKSVFQIPFEEKISFLIEQDDPSQRSLTYYILYAIRYFYETNKVLPFNGHLPDLYTTTAWYSELKRIYASKHTEDCEEIYRIAFLTLLKDLMSIQNVTEDVEVPEETRKVVEGKLEARLRSQASKAVRNVFGISVVEYNSNLWDDVLLLPRETTVQGYSPESLWRQYLQRLIATVLQNKGEETSFPNYSLCAALLAALEARRLFFKPSEEACKGVEKREPHVIVFETLREIVEETPLERGEGDLQGEAGLNVVALLEDNREALLKACKEVSHTFPISPYGEDYVSEIPSVANAVGSVAAQELIKALQGQCYPLVRPLVYSGYTNTLEHLELI